jgi:hypothetical protein
MYRMATIPANGGSTIYFDDDDTFYIDTSGPNSVSAIGGWPVTIENSDLNGYLKVIFRSDITFTSFDQYFRCGSEYIQFGDFSLDASGERAKITINGISDYLGLINNEPYNNIRIFNISVLSAGGSTLELNAGWVCQSNFMEGVVAEIVNGFIVNCFSSGEIPFGGGGIVGGYSSFITVRGCSSTGATGIRAGGIVGRNCSAGTISECYSTGTIAGAAGGIVGVECTGGVIFKCYSTGPITGLRAGGIVGEDSNNLTVNDCYSRGNIQGQLSGGIIGANAGRTDPVNVENCYSTGDINGGGGTDAGGICGSGYSSGNISGCYTSGAGSGNGIFAGTNSDSPGTNYSEANNSGSGWNDTNANTVLTNEPSISPVGEVWAFDPADPADPSGPYIFSSFGYTPYSAANIDPATLELVKTHINSIPIPAEGGTTDPALIIVDHTFYILSINGQDPAIYPELLTFDISGIIIVPPNITPDIYTFVIYDTVNPYTTTTLQITVDGPLPPPPPVPCCAPTAVYSGLSGDVVTSFRTGNRLIVERFSEPNMRFPSHTYYLKYKMALGAKK